MTVTNTMGAAELLRKYLESPAGSDLLGEMVKMAAELLMDADVDAICGAGYGERSPDRVNSLGEAAVSPPRLKRPTVGLPGRLGELADAWLTEYPAATAVAYLCDLRSFVDFCMEAGIDPLKVKRVDLARFAASLSATGRAPANVARSLSGLSSFYGHLVATGVLSVSPATGLRRPRRAGGVRLGLSSDELAGLLVAARCRGPVPFCLAALLGTAGLRVCEACGLAVADRGRDAGAPVVYALRKGGVKKQRWGEKDGHHLRATRQRTRRIGEWSPPGRPFAHRPERGMAHPPAGRSHCQGPWHRCRHRTAGLPSPSASRFRLHRARGKGPIVGGRRRGGALRPSNHAQ